MKHRVNPIGYNNFNIMAGHTIEKAVWEAIEQIEKESGEEILSKNKMTLKKSDSIDSAITKITNIITKIVFE